MLERDDPYPRPGRRGRPARRCGTCRRSCSCRGTAARCATTRSSGRSCGTAPWTRPWPRRRLQRGAPAPTTPAAAERPPRLVVGWDDNYPAATSAPPRPAPVPSSSRTAGAPLGRAATSRSPTTTARSGRRSRCSTASRPPATTTPSTSTTRWAGRGASASGARPRGSPPVHERRRRQRHRRELPPPSRARPTKSVSRRRSPRSSRRRWPAPARRRRRLPHRGSAAPVAVTTGADFVVAVRLTTPGTRDARSPSSIRPSCWPRAPPPRAPSSAATASPGRTSATRAGFAASDVCLKAFVDRRGAATTAARVRPRAGFGRPGRGRTRALHAHGSGVLLRQRRGQALAARRRAGARCAQLRIPAVTVNERDTWRFAAPGAARGLQDRRPRLGRRRAPLGAHARSARGAGPPARPGSSPRRAAVRECRRGGGLLRGREPVRECAGDKGSMMRRTWMLVAVAACVVVIVLERRPRWSPPAARNGVRRRPWPSRRRRRRPRRPSRSSPPAIVTAGDPATARRPSRHPRRRSSSSAAGPPGDTDFHAVGPLDDRRPRRRDVPCAARARTTTYRVDYAGDGSSGCRPPPRPSSPCARRSPSRRRRGSTAASAPGSP